MTPHTPLLVPLTIASLHSSDSTSDLFYVDFFDYRLPGHYRWISIDRKGLRLGIKNRI